ncbi:hypothetical protein VT06_08905 [Arsukibacterium sp. MJ3]|uniref:hypothetical protein n=1 Tax=Arsukibacterium sp. MJ3 TaxID=1632859 RepID=UPI000627174C|nr:hypothetical protein [Arsukibacterium sp. MJ3]KKO49091.1 hypothetical protein VT06_08905 [Arsukibacterium sp. MJ3]
MTKADKLLRVFASAVKAGGGIHTKRPVEQLAANLYFDPDIKMYRANTEQALTDLKYCQRNLHMLQN